jgi:molecular chaperone DnaJ
MLTRPVLDVLLYEVLEVSPKACTAVVKAAYRCLVQQYHPDRNPGDLEAAKRMSQINHAYSVLSDPLLRAQYDASVGIRATERRGGGRASSPARPDAAKVRADLRPFAFRPLD